MTVLYETKKFRYEIFELKYLNEMANLVAQAFTFSDPMAIVQNFTIAEFADYVELLGRNIEEQKLTIVAKDKLTNKLVGAVIAADFISDSTLNPENSDELSIKFEPIVELLMSLEHQYTHNKQIKIGEYLHVYMLAVSPEYRGERIAQNLVRLCLENGVQRDFSNAVTEAANSISQHIFKKLDFMSRHEISYQEFTYQGEQIFSSIEGHSGTILMDKSLI